MNAFICEEVAQNYFKQKTVNDGKRKTRRGKRISKSQRQQEVQEKTEEKSE